MSTRVEGRLGIRVLVVEEILLMCQLIAGALADESDLNVVGYATTFREAIRRAQHSDVIVVSALLSNNGAFKLTRMLRRICPAVRVIVIGLSETPPDVASYLAAGAAGCTLHDDSVAALLETIRATPQPRGERVRRDSLT